jgi:hypothetical protein
VGTSVYLDGEGNCDTISTSNQLSDLSDVNTSTPTNRNVLVADGVDFESRALVEADISDLSHTVDTNANTICTGTSVYLDGEGNCDTITPAAQLSDLSDVDTSTPTNRNVLVADGVDFESRALVEADISDLTHTTDTNANTICTGTGNYLDGEGNCDALTTFPGFTDLDTDYGNEVITSDFSFETGTLEIPNSATLPGTCDVGDMYMDSDATSGERFFLCESTDTWVTQGGGASFTDLDTDYGDEVITSDYSFATGTLEIPNSNTLPGTCDVGDTYMDSDAASGAMLFLCESTNTWVAQGSGVGSGTGGGQYYDHTFSWPSGTTTGTPIANIDITHGVGRYPDKIEVFFESNDGWKQAFPRFESTGGTDFGWIIEDFSGMNDANDYRLQLFTGPDGGGSAANAIARAYWWTNDDIRTATTGLKTGLSGGFDMSLATEFDTGDTIDLGAGAVIIYGKWINFGALPNTTTSTVAHSITGLDQILSIDAVYRNVSDLTSSSTAFGNLPHVDGTLADNIEVTVDGTNISVTTGSDQQALFGLFLLKYTR